MAVAVPAPLYKAFDYRVPGEGPCTPGMRVRVPFGRRTVVGVVLEAPRAEVVGTGIQYKSIAAVLDAEPLLPTELLDLCRWAAGYYQHPIGEVLATALPSALRQGGATRIGEERALRITAAGRIALATLPARNRAQRAMLEALAAGPRPRSELDASAAMLSQATKQGWIESFVVDETPVAAEPAPALTAEQASSLALLREAQGPSTGLGTGFDVTVLEGITGSGKTELYLQRAADVLALGRQVLVLVPEIGLTPQLTERFARRFGGKVARYHSGMADGERAQAWLRARAGRTGIVVGTRSAAFLPFAKLGLIIVDEEHDGSFKQQDGLRYSARDLVIVRAQKAGVPVILGSATPSFETLHNASAGRYRRARLTRRVHAVAPPAIRLLDVRGRPLDHGMSAPLLEAIGKHLDAGGQSLLFLNRRGYAPVLLCHDCGWQAPCKQCDSRMTMHRGRGRLVCHHCGAESGVPVKCESCQSRALLPVGEGTERIEDGLRDAFPGKRIERFDSDRIRKRGELERLLEDTRSGAIHILIGTQMLAKGHDFAGLSLVGIVDVDHALYGSDFRALERMGQLVTQVAGRAGRVGQQAEVILQTHEPHHPALRSLLEKGYAGFAESLLAQRKQLGLPPFAHLALLRAEATARGAALTFLQEAAALLRAEGVALLGPIPSPMERLGGRYRAQLLLQSGSRAALQKLLAAQVPSLDDLKSARPVRWSVDIDPLDLF
ncbi:MAG TPA: primosomal protein N' [Verrucomicrobiae bacterium]|nr:primosomal protein N' [Verrucomicrobiae bacterium]